MPKTGGAHPPDEPAAPPSAESAATPSAATQISDADDLRGYHFKRLLGKGSTWTWILAVALVVAIVVLLVVDKHRAVVALGAFAVAVLGGIVFVWFKADKEAADDFFELYAKRHGLELNGRSSLPPTTPLLRRGDDRYAERSLSGRIADDCEGILALYTYEEEHTDSNGNRDTDYYRYTVGLVNVPECAQFVPELYCQKRFGFRALEGFEDAFRTKKERVKLESEALDDKYEIFAKKGQDANRLRQLFEPTFIVWLTDSAPDKFAFELVDGNLCAYVSGHKEDAVDLETVSAATATVARRLREEANE